MQANTNANINNLKLSYLAIDNTFTPAFSMNFFFPVPLSLYRESAETAPQDFQLATTSTSQGQQEFF